MTQLPTIPTDNLYKFIAIAGLVALAASYVAEAILIQSAATASFDEVSKYYERDLASSDASLKQVDRLLTEFEAKLRMPDAADEKLIKNIAETWRLKLERIEAKLQILKENRNSQRELIISHFDVNAVNFQQMCDRLFTLRVIGFCACILGFVLWFLRTQRHLDRLLVRGVTQAADSRESQ